MSVPANLRVGPFTTQALVKKSYLLYYIFLIWISIFAIQLEFWAYWNFFLNILDYKFIHFIAFMPFLIFGMYVTAVFVSLIFAKLFLVIINAIHPPREGTFLRDRSDRDYRYWSLRATIKKWPVWLAHKFPFPFLDNICFKMFDVKTKFSNSLFEGWVDCEFIEFGKDVTVGQATIIQSATIAGDFFILRKTIIEDRVRIGAHCVIMPGTHIGKDSILASNSITMVGQHLEGGYIHSGQPADKVKKNVFFEDDLEDKLKEQFNKTR